MLLVGGWHEPAQFTERVVYLISSAFLDHAPSFLSRGDLCWAAATAAYLVVIMVSVVVIVMAGHFAGSRWRTGLGLMISD